MPPGGVGDVQGDGRGGYLGKGSWLETSDERGPGLPSGP